MTITQRLCAVALLATLSACATAADDVVSSAAGVAQYRCVTGSGVVHAVSVDEAAGTVDVVRDGRTTLYRGLFTNDEIIWEDRLKALPITAGYRLHREDLTFRTVSDIGGEKQEARIGACEKT